MRLKTEEDLDLIEDQTKISLESIRDSNNRDRKGDYLRYDHRSRHRVTESIFGQKVDQYIVYVRNRGYGGGYFTVRFYFYDSRGLVRDTALMTKYVGPSDEKAFVYRDVDYSYRYYSWDYRVISESKIPSRNDYDNRDRYGGGRDGRY